MKSLREVDVKDKVVLLRADFNVPFHKIITDDSRIVKTMPTINYLLDQEAKQIIILTHFGRPKEKEEEFRVKPIAERLDELLDVQVGYVDDCLKSPGKHKVVVMENTRFYKEDKKNDDSFAKRLSHNADIFVFDAFGAAHRDHASTTGVMKYIKESCIGFIVSKELKMLGFKEAKKPFVALIGAAKVSDKIPVLEGLLKKVDTLLLGGAIIFTFYKAQGLEVGNSLVEEKMIPVAKKLMEDFPDKIILPIDVVVSEEAEGAEIFTVDYDKIPPNMKGLDIGDGAVELFKEEIDSAQTVFWNGPLGLFEVPPFDHATLQIAEYLSTKKITSIIGGGDTEKAVSQFVSLFSHVSTGGGAALELIAGHKLVVIEKLRELST